MVKISKQIPPRAALLIFAIELQQDSFDIVQGQTQCTSQFGCLTNFLFLYWLQKSDIYLVLLYVNKLLINHSRFFIYQYKEYNVATYCGSLDSCFECFFSLYCSDHHTLLDLFNISNEKEIFKFFSTEQEVDHDKRIINPYI